MREDVSLKEFEEKGLVWLSLLETKTTQKGETPRLVLKGRAAQALVHWIEVAKIKDGPLFRPISKGEAVIRYFDRVIAAVFLALGIDIAPFLLAMLILAFAYEPLMRDIDPGDDDAHKDQATRIAADESSVIRAQFATTER